jgi:DNA uptake protein ComE-like DNA-binding protein
MATVVQNYTPEQVTQLVAGYTEGQSVEALAVALGKSVRSVIAKLSKEGVYKAKEKTAAGSVLRKADLIEAIAAKVGVPSEQLESLEKATKEALELIQSALATPAK